MLANSHQLSPRILAWLDTRCSFSIEYVYPKQTSRQTTNNRKKSMRSIRFRPVFFLTINNHEMLTYAKNCLACKGIVSFIETLSRKGGSYRMKIRGIKNCINLIHILVNSEKISFFTCKLKQLFILEKILPKMQNRNNKEIDILEIIDVKLRLNQPENRLESVPFFKTGKNKKSKRLSLSAFFILLQSLRQQNNSHDTHDTHKTHNAEQDVLKQTYSRKHWEDRLGIKEGACEKKGNKLFLQAEKHYQDFISTLGEEKKQLLKNNFIDSKKLKLYLVGVLETKGEIYVPKAIGLLSSGSPKISFSLRRGEELLVYLLCQQLRDYKPEITLTTHTIRYDITETPLIKNFYLFLKKFTTIHIYKDNLEEFREWCKKQGW